MPSGKLLVTMIVVSLGVVLAVKHYEVRGAVGPARRTN